MYLPLCQFLVNPRKRYLRFMFLRLFRLPLSFSHISIHLLSYLFMSSNYIFTGLILGNKLLELIKTVESFVELYSTDPATLIMYILYLACLGMPGDHIDGRIDILI